MMETVDLALWVLAIFGALAFLLTVWRMLGWVYEHETERKAESPTAADAPFSVDYNNGYGGQQPGIYLWRKGVAEGKLVIPVRLSDCQAVQITQWINHPAQCEHYWHYGPDCPAGDPESAAKIKELVRLAAEEEAKDPEKAKARSFYATTHGAGVAGLSQFPGFDSDGRPTFHNSSAYDLIHNPLGQRE